MVYLTFTEYERFGFTGLDEQKFDELLPIASDILDSITRSFYEFNDIDKDNDYRSSRFKKALATQMEHFDEVGATTEHGMKTHKSVTIGRTSLSDGSNSASSDDVTSFVSSGVLMHLKDTGLLYRGLGGRHGYATS